MRLREAGTGHPRRAHLIRHALDERLRQHGEPRGLGLGQEGVRDERCVDAIRLQRGQHVRNGDLDELDTGGVDACFI
ncbi:MAG: hypothetical protein NT132_08840 [Microbacterium sp.]|nr:hypothetical protein [Microbacterium sp.]